MSTTLFKSDIKRCWRCPDIRNKVNRSWFRSYGQNLELKVWKRSLFQYTDSYVSRHEDECISQSKRWTFFTRTEVELTLTVSVNSQKGLCWCELFLQVDVYGFDMHWMHIMSFAPLVALFPSSAHEAFSYPIIKLIVFHFFHLQKQKLSAETLGKFKWRLNKTFHQVRMLDPKSTKNHRRLI